MFFVLHLFQIERMKRWFVKLAIECRRINRSILLNRIYRPTLRYIQLKGLGENFREYHQLVILYRSAYTLWGRVAFVYLMISIPMNGMCVLTLNTPGLLFDQMFTVFLIFISHSLSITILMFGIAMQTQTLQVVSKYLVPIIQSIASNNSLWIKFKYDDWFNRLSFGQKYGPNLTLVGALTYQTIVNVRFPYFIDWLIEIIFSILFFR